MSKPAIFGLVSSEQQARIAVTALEAAGFIPTDISVLTGGVTYDINGVPETGFAKTRQVGHVNATKAPEGTTAGVTTGGVIGGVAGWLVAIGALAVPGLGPLVAAGPILAALSGAALGATAGGITGALIGYGIPEFEAKLYAGRVESGHILIGVHAVNDDEASAAQDALEAAGAEHIKVTSEVTVE
jgi:hypothetical protein